MTSQAPVGNNNLAPVENNKPSPGLNRSELKVLISEDFLPTKGDDAGSYHSIS